MRRPMVPMAAGLSSGIFTGYHISSNIMIWGVVFFTILISSGLFLVFLKNSKTEKDERREKRRPLWVFALFLLLGMLSLWNSDRISAKTDLPVGKEVDVAGEALSLKTKEKKKHQMEIETKQGRILVRWYDSLPGDDIVGREVRVTGLTEIPQGRRNPKCFDYLLYLKTRKIDVILTAEHLEIGKIRNPINYSASKITTNFEESIRPFMKAERRELVIAMLFGDKSGLEEEDYEKFQMTGTAHLLAASGLHVGVVYGFLLLLLRGRQSRVVQLIIIGCLVFYAAMAGFAPSIIRAVIMIILHILSDLYHYRYDLLSSAAFTASAMLAANPYALFGLGFQMSFLAIFALSMFTGPAWENLREGGMGKKVLVPIFVIQGSMAPFTAYTFNYFSFMAFLANIPMIFLAGILIPMGVVTMLASLLINQSAFFATMLDVASGGMIACNDFFYGGRGAMDVVSPPVFILALYYPLGFYFMSEMRRIQTGRREYEKVVRWIAASVMVAVIFTALTEDGLGGKPIIFVDVGQGNCLCITTPKKRMVLIDGGGSRNYDVGKKVLKPYLLKNGISTVDIAIVSHMDEDHYGGIRFLRGEGMIDNIVFAQGQEVDGLKEVRFATKGEVIYEEDGFSITAMGPLEPAEDGNEGSLVLKVVYGELTILVPGDISAETEGELIREYKREDALAADVLVVPHHGSKYSSSEDFLDAVNPRIAIIQVGKNNYGHPAPSVIEKYEEKRIMVYRNDERGAIGLGGGNDGSIQLQTQQ